MIPEPKDGGARLELSLKEKLYPLLQALLAQLRRSRETPLQFGIDSEGIVTAAMKDFLAGVTDEQPGQWRDWQLVTVALDELIAQFLEPHCSSRREEAHLQFGIRNSEFGIDWGLLRSVAPIEWRGTRTTNTASPHALVVWLERFYTVVREVQPRAIDIVGLRVEGFQDRDIAERLGLSLRLVKRIVQDMRVNWERVTSKE
ncbi:MAG: hypothetical protein L0387_35315 [Acidobacteria bacterium]|nr:hypothetical protein [Acidobacteriota bacterium]